ncbi:hypothetical protein D5S18_13385 [Nocardia panacis]|uniref:Secreted protein n=1 Tax=Nocardia panacis TaxID=2340916 RepID=A0A3A4KNH4_9NOCA|nr:hypothetical protein [Nocardia panacis]RJO75774.1 hypothetical protein D5S18_13385 [Nocardia panacis]
MSFVRTTVFVGLAAAALSALGATTASAEPIDYGQAGHEACAAAGLEYTEAIYLPGTRPATVTCHRAGDDTVIWLPMAAGVPCELGPLARKPGVSDGQGNCVKG